MLSAGTRPRQSPAAGYTLSIYLKEFFGPQAAAWDTRVLATDISHQALDKAMAGIYPKPADMPDSWVRRYFRPAGQAGEYQVSRAIRDNVIFRVFNLMDPIRFRVKFDVIFCRNVMIYFDQPTRDALVRRFADATVPGGWLFISHSESLGQNSPYSLVAPAVYRKK